MKAPAGAADSTGGLEVTNELPANSQSRPNLFVVGAPKCGTTSLCNYLGRHPQVFFPRTKEPLFFCADCVHDEYWRIDDPDAYLALFAPGAERKWRGEGSVWYLMSEVAAKRIRAYSPDARIIIMLRNPVDMVASLHAQFLFSGNESIRDFEKAYAAQEARAQGRRIPWRAHTPGGLLYTQVGRYAEQVERYLEQFPRGQVKVLIFEEFVADLAAGYRDVLAFLEVDTGFTPEFTVDNERHNVRSAALQRLVVKVPELWRWPWRLPPGPARDRLLQQVERLRAALKDFNGAGRRPPPFDPALRQRLHGDFADDIARLERLLGRDLSAWQRKNLEAAPRPEPHSPQAASAAAVRAADIGR